MAQAEYKKWLEPDNLALLKGWKMKGLTDQEIAKNIGVAYQTLSVWRSKYSEINEVLKKGKEHANFQIENQLFQKAMDGNMTAIIFWLKNNYREKYSESKLAYEEIELTQAKTRKEKAQALLAEWQAKQVTEPENNTDKTVIVDDFAKEEIDDAKDN